MGLRYRQTQTPKPSRWPAIFSGIAVIISSFSLYLQLNSQSTTDAVINRFEVSSEPDIWRANIAVTFVNSGSRQSFISNVNILYAATASNQYAEKCTRDIGIYDKMKLIKDPIGLIVPTAGMTPATYSFEDKKQVSQLDMAFPYEICVEYESIGSNGVSFNKRKYIGDYLVYNDRVERENDNHDELKEPTRIIPRRSMVEFFRTSFGDTSIFW